MDCNSYSYTAPGFGVDYPAPVAEYRNDDMRAEITMQGRGAAMVYHVWAGSYDGDLDVYETFTALEAARALYDHIVTNYSHTPPVRQELRRAILAAHRADSMTARGEVS